MSKRFCWAVREILVLFDHHIKQEKKASIYIYIYAGEYFFSFTYNFFFFFFSLSQYHKFLRNFEVSHLRHWQGFVFLNRIFFIILLFG